MQGDSGGPLTYRQNGQHVLVGVVSYSSKSNPETMNTRIAYVRKWIDDTLKTQTDVKFCRNGGNADHPLIQSTINQLNP